MQKNENLLYKAIAASDTENAMRLIRSGCDVNCKGQLGTTALHEAVIRNLIEVARELILRGADLNAKDGAGENMSTPLCRAISQGNLEAVCLLLYYQASVNIPVWDGSHLIVAISRSDNDIVEVLLDYCKTWYLSVEGWADRTALGLAVCEENPIAIDLVKRGASVNCVDDRYRSPLHDSLRHDSNELFKLIWPKFLYNYNMHNILKYNSGQGTFLNRYIHHCAFSNSQWLEGFYLILQSPVNFDVIREYEDDKDEDEEEEKESILHKILIGLALKEIKLKDRISIIYILLSLDAKVAAVDLQSIHLLFGSNDEFEAIVYAGEVSYNDYKEQMRLLFKEPFNSDIAVDMYQKFYCYSKYIELRKKTLCSLGFFSVSPEKRKQYLAWIEEDMPEKHEVILEKLDQIPQIPSLLELSRDQAQKCIEEDFKIDKAYQFFDVVKNLKFPPIIEDIILFKQPIY